MTQETKKNEPTKTCTCAAGACRCGSGLCACNPVCLCGDCQCSKK